jgi:hypothetical protein
LLSIFAKSMVILPTSFGWSGLIFDTRFNWTKVYFFANKCLLLSYTIWSFINKF